MSISPQYQRPIQRILIVAAVVTIGISQILFNLITNNLPHFPPTGLFFFYVILTVQIIPIILILCVDIGVTRLLGDGWVFRVWRSLLFAFVFLSIFRQAQLVIDPFDDWLKTLSSFKQLGILLLAAGLPFGIALYAHRVFNLFFTYLALLALMLTGIFVFQTGLFGPAWWHETAPAAPKLISSQSPDIFIILFDELSYGELLDRGEIDQQSFPNFAELARDGLWFTQARTNYPETNRSIQTLLTGTLVEGPDLFPAPTLFQRLASYYHVNIFEEKSVLARQFGCAYASFTCQGSLYTLTKSPVSTGKWATLQLTNLLVPVKIARFIGYLPESYSPALPRLTEKMRTAGAGPQLFYWHTILPHPPYIFNPDGTRHESVNLMFRPGNDPAKVYLNYRKQLQFVDRLLGEPVAELKSSGAYERSILVITADHGILAQPYDSYRVPLIIHGPGVLKGVTDVEYQHVDFIPTLFDILDIPYDSDERLQGYSAMDIERPTRPVPGID